MTTPLAPPMNRGGLLTAAAVVTSPRTAFAALRALPTWGWAYLVAVLLAIAGAFLIQPALVHAMAASMPALYAKNPAIANLPPEKQQQAIANAVGLAQTFAKFQWISSPFAILIVGLVQAIGLVAIAKIGRSTATFKQFWAVAINITIVSIGMSSLVTGLISLLRGADAYANTTELLTTLPSLAWIAPEAPAKAVAFLSGVSNPFALWSTVLAILALTIVGGLKRSVAIVGGIVLLVLGAAIGAAFVQ